MKVAAVQMAARPGAVQENLERAARLVEQAIQQEAQLICLPELFSVGYFCRRGEENPDYLSLAEPLDGPTVGRMAEMARARRVAMVVPFFERAGPGLFFNSVAVLGPDGTPVGVYRKTHVPWSRTGWEKFYFRPGDRYPVFSVLGWPLGVLVCYDRVFPEVTRILAVKGARLLVVPSGAPAWLADSWLFVLRTRAYENQVYLVAPNLCGRAGPGGHAFAGRSLVADPAGNLLCQAGEEEEAVLVAQLSGEELERQRREQSLWRDRRPETYGELLSEEALRLG